MSLNCYSLILGARNTPSKGRKFLKRDETLIRTLTAAHFPDGFTILSADGGWFDPAKKTFVEEESRQILVCAKNKAALRTWCGELGRALKQKELLVVELGKAKTFRFKRT